MEKERPKRGDIGFVLYAPDPLSPPFKLLCNPFSCGPVFRGGIPLNQDREMQRGLQNPEETLVPSRVRRIHSPFVVVRCIDFQTQAKSDQK